MNWVMSSSDGCEAMVWLKEVECSSFWGTVTASRNSFCEQDEQVARGWRGANSSGLIIYLSFSGRNHLGFKLCGDEEQTEV